MQWMNALILFVAFVALILAASLHGLSVSGHFPRRPDAAAFPYGFGAALLFGSIALVIVALVGGIASALRIIPWYAAIIGGGFSLLAAPLVLRGFPDRFVDSRRALLAFAGATAAIALLLLWLVVSYRCAASGDRTLCLTIYTTLRAAARPAARPEKMQPPRNVPSNAALP